MTISTERPPVQLRTPPHHRAGTTSRARRWIWPAGFAAAGLILFLAYLRQAATTPLRSDGASNVLQAWDLLHGNPLLRGWTLSDVSFYTTELPQYALIEVVRGLNASVVDWAAAMTYTLLVLGAAALARGAATGLTGLVRALLAAGIMLAPSAAGTLTLLANPDHTGTQVALVTAWLVLDRFRHRWWGPPAVAVLLAWAQIADPMALFEGALPIALVCGSRLYRRRHEPCDLLLTAGALVSCGAASVTLGVIRSLGGFAVMQPYAVFTQISSLYSHLSVTAESVLILYGADFSGEQLGPAAAITLVHLIGVALALWAIILIVRRFGTCELLVQVLAVSLLIVLTAYTLNGTMTAGSDHEVVGALPLGAVLAGRVLAIPLIRARHLPALALILACYAGALAHHAAQPPAADPDREIVTWLQHHQLRYGFASYWTASAVTVDSGETIRVRPVSRTGPVLSVVPWESKASWYDASHDPRFVIISRHSGLCWRMTIGDWQHAARRTFGTPTATYHVAGYLILVWKTNMLASHQLATIQPTSPAMC